MIVRPVQARDLGDLVELCAEHAAFERATYDPVGKRERLGSLLLCADPRLWAWVAEDQGSLLGYATASEDISTWSACRFMHMDCLFVREAHRNRGVGPQLINEIQREASRRQIEELQWQTPRWNESAHRFYRRLGATASEKYRYTLRAARG